jgi:hypothetical protein
MSWVLKQAAFHDGRVPKEPPAPYYLGRTRPVAQDSAAAWYTSPGDAIEFTTEQDARDFVQERGILGEWRPVDLAGELLAREAAGPSGKPDRG